MKQEEKELILLPKEVILSAPTVVPTNGRILLERREVKEDDQIQIIKEAKKFRYYVVAIADDVTDKDIKLGYEMFLQTTPYRENRFDKDPQYFKMDLPIIYDDATNNVYYVLHETESWGKRDNSKYGQKVLINKR